MRLFEPSTGQMHARLVGEWDDDNKLSARLEKFMGNFNTEMTLPESGSLDCVFDPDENALRGHWKTDAGTEGDLWWVCVANQPPVQALTPVADLAPAEQTSPRRSGRVRRFFTKPGRDGQGKRRTRWLAIVVGVGVAAIAGYFLMSFLLDALTNG